MIAHRYGGGRMLPTVQAYLILQLFRVICVCAGCFMAYLGYRLFQQGIYEKQGELRASYGKTSLVLRQVGPGIFFALFGIAIAYTGFLRKFEAGPAIETTSSSGVVGDQGPQSKGGTPTSEVGETPRLGNPDASAGNSSKPTIQVPPQKEPTFGSKDGPHLEGGIGGGNTKLPGMAELTHGQRPQIEDFTRSNETVQARPKVEKQTLTPP